MSFPKILQIEPTNSCNFGCIMCMRNFFSAPQGFMNMSLYRKIIEEAEGQVKRLVLYGQGEPLFHPNFIQMIALAREFMGLDVQLFFSTNGSLLNRDVADKLLKTYKVDEISFSVDTTDFAKLERIRIGAVSEVIFKNLKYVAELKKKLDYDFKLGVEAVVMKSNIDDLPDLVKNMSEIGVDYIVVSQMIPYTELISHDTAYLTVSREIIEMVGDIARLDWEIVRRAVYESYSFMYGHLLSRESELSLKEIWNQAKRLGLEVNLPLLIEKRDTIRLIKKAEENFKIVKEITESNGILIDIPEIFVNTKKRSCPYIEKEAMVIRHDGKVTPCFNFIYSHPIYVNNHIRMDNEVILGNVSKQTIEEIWNSKQYLDLRERLKNISDNVPWCGDCPYSTLGCWFTRNNKMDCYGNEPSCSECLYSVGIAKCII